MIYHIKHLYKLFSHCKHPDQLIINGAKTETLVTSSASSPQVQQAWAHWS